MKTFINIQYPYKDAKYVIFPVPYESTETFASGTRQGPEKILIASGSIEEYDFEEKIDLLNVPIHTLQEVDVPQPPEVALEWIENRYREYIKDNKFVIMIGGEHTITLGAIRSFADKFTVVSFDAHFDLRDEYLSQKYSHTTVMRRVYEKAPVVFVGQRTASKEEEEFLNREHIPYFKKPDIEKILESINTDKVYLSIDMDVLDPALMPAVANPEPDGILWNDLIDCLRKIIKEKIIIGVDIVEFSPLPGILMPDIIVSKLLAKIITFLVVGKKL